MLLRPARLVVLLFFIGLVGLVACGASVRVKTLRASLVTLNAARDVVLQVSKEREAQIVARATSKDEGRAALDAWRAKVDAVVAAIEVGYRAVHDAALLSDAKSASEAAAATKKALALLKDLKEPSKEPSPSTKETKP